ncbi:MAG: heparinase II/III family protein [archaeon]|nr:heparinase II/III family protein [archaeon]
MKKEGVAVLFVFLLILSVMFFSFYNYKISGRVSEEILNCSNNTVIGQCSVEKPKYCSYNNPNLVKNGDFETEEIGKKTLPQYWLSTASQNTSYNIEWGSFGKLFSIEQKYSVNQWIGVQNEVQLSPSTSYKLTAFLYCQDCSIPQNFTLAVHVRPRNNPTSNFYCTTPYCSDNFLITPNYFAGYTKVELIFTTNNTNELYGYIIPTFIPKSTGKAYLDNVSLVKLNYQPQLINNCEICGCNASEICRNNSCIAEEIPIIPVLNITNVTDIVDTINIKTFDYFKTEQEPVGKIAMRTGMELNSIPNEIHPVVLYTDINLIKNRITREPYKSWWNQIKTTNGWVLNYPISNLTKLDKARYAKIIAFTYAVTKEEKYGDKARDLLLDMNTGYYKENEEVEGLIWFSESYDMLKGAKYNFEKTKLSVCKKDCNCHRVWTFKNYGRMKCDTCYSCESRIWNNIKGQMENLATTDIGEIGSNDMVRTNNLHIRRYSAVGVAAIVLHNKEYFDNAMNGGTTLGVAGKIANPVVKFFSGDAGGFEYDGVKDTINHQIVDYDEGGWAEGPFYMRYAFLAAIPYMKAMENAGVGNNWLDATTLNNLFEWGIKIRMPNGARPPFDDSNVNSTYFFNGYLNNPVYNWDWINSNKPYFSNDWGSVTLIDNICYYDDSVKSVAPDWEPTQILPKTGEIILRSGWEKNDTYLAFFAENGRAVERGYGHEHSDTLSFVLYAYEKYLAIDPGYINWDNRDKTNSPGSHNVVLIDGMLMTNSYINEKSSFSTEFLDYGEASDNFQHERGILFIDKDYYIVFDLINNAKSGAELLMHGNGLISKGTAKQYSPSAGEWIQGNVGLLFYTLKNPTDVIKFKEATDSQEYGKSSKHTYMSVLRTGSKIGFLSLLYPSQNRDYPVITFNKTKENLQFLKMEKDGWKGIAFVNEQNKMVNLVQENVNIETDASKLFVKSENNELRYIFADDVTKINLAGKNFLISDAPTTVAMKYNGSVMEIYYWDSGNIKLATNVLNIIYNNQELSNTGGFVNI